MLACCFTRQKSSVPPSGRAPYGIDGLMHNDVVKSDVHSTDTHGYKVAGKTLLDAPAAEGS